MAQFVGYFEDNVTFTEGPFVVCAMPMSRDFRIEAEHKGRHCPALPDISLYPIIRKLGLGGKTEDRALMEKVCNALNQMVRDGEIVLVGNYWCSKQEASRRG